MPSAYVHVTPTARVEHKCCECEGTISKGEKYHKHSGIWDGEASAYKVCQECEQLRVEVDRLITDKYEGTAFGELFDAVTERNCDPALLARYVDNALRRGAVVPPWVLNIRLHGHEPVLQFQREAVL